MKNEKIGLILSILICLFSIISTTIFNGYNDSRLQIVLLGMISIISFFIYKLNSNEYPYILYFLSLALLFHTSLVTSYIWGWDINKEYNLANNVLVNNFWNINTSSGLNSMITTVIFSPLLNLISNINLVWIYKIIIPIIFAFVPVVIYLICSKIFNKIIAIYAGLFLIFTVVFYTEMLQLVRQQIAELILVLLLYIYLIKNERNDNKQYIPIILLLIITLVLSHYALTYIYIFIFTSGYILYKISKTNDLFKLDFKVPINHIIFLTAFAVVWYFYTSTSDNVFNLLYNVKTIYTHVTTDLFNPQSTEALKLIVTSQATIFQNINKIFLIFFQFMIFIGLTTTILKNKKNIHTFIIISLINILFLISNIVLPYLSNSLNTTRIYHISILILSPFAIVGLILSLNIIPKLKTKNNFMIISLLLIIYFNLQNGLVYNFVGINGSIALSKNVDYPLVANTDLSVSDWFIQHSNNKNIYADANRIYMYASKGYKNIAEIRTDIPGNSTIYLSKYNVKSDELTIIQNDKYTHVKYNFNQINVNTIYANDNSKLLYNQKELIIIK